MQEHHSALTITVVITVSFLPHGRKLYSFICTWILHLILAKDFKWKIFQGDYICSNWK